jgi:hypothetical protein
MIFDQALKDLTAVVGVALIPVITQASKFLHQFGAVLYPITEALMPAVAEVMGSINDVFLAFLPAFSSFGGIVVDVARIFGELARDISTFLLPNIRSFTTVFAGIVSVVRTVLQSFAGLLGPNVRDGFKNLGQWLARFTTAIAGLIFKLLGMDAALGAMIASLQDGADKAGRKDAQGLAAAQNARLVGVADIGREALQRAFVASGIAGQDKGDIDDQEFRKRMVADLEAIRKGEGLKAIIVEAILAARQVIAPGEKLNDAAVGAARGAGNIAVGAGAGPLVMILKGLGIL